MVKFAWFFMGLLLLSPAAVAENKASAAFGCAPWDGQTLEISVQMPAAPDAAGAPPVMLRATLWGKGLEDVRSGSVTSLRLPRDGGTDMKGSGYPSYCSGQKCSVTQNDVIVEFSKAELREGGVVAGTMRFDILDNFQTFSFSAVLGGHQLCG